MSSEYSYTVTCAKENLKLIRRHVFDSIRSFNISDKDMNMLVLAVDEICANLIIHSSNESKDDSLEIEISKHKDGVQFVITDFGVAFDLETYEEPEIKEIIEQRRKGGMGLMLVNRIMDDVEYESMADRNITRLYKKLSA